MPRISANEFERTRKKRPESQPLPVPIEEELDRNPIEDEPAAAPVQIVETRIEFVTVEIPLGEPPRRFDQVHIEGWLRGDVAHKFARLRDALLKRHASTSDGRAVKTNPDVMRWLMEQFAA